MIISHFIRAHVQKFWDKSDGQRLRVAVSQEEKCLVHNSKSDLPLVRTLEVDWIFQYQVTPQSSRHPKTPQSELHYSLFFILLCSVLYWNWRLSRQVPVAISSSNELPPEGVSSKCPIKHGRKWNLAMKHFVSMKKLVLVGVQPNLQSQLIQVRKQNLIFRILMTKLPL